MLADRVGKLARAGYTVPQSSYVLRHSLRFSGTVRKPALDEFLVTIVHNYQYLQLLFDAKMSSGLILRRVVNFAYFSQFCATRIVLGTLLPLVYPVSSLSPPTPSGQCRRAALVFRPGPGTACCRPISCLSRRDATRTFSRGGGRVGTDSKRVTKTMLTQGPERGPGR